jgi:hypothetical protein
MNTITQQSDVQLLLAAILAIETDPQFPRVNYLFSVRPDYSVLPKNEGCVSGSAHPLVEAAIRAADTALITNKGECNWAAHRELEKHGYRVYAGEKDSFGWLTGCINTKKGVLVYG